ncbi:MULTISPECIES: hypothetical protein [unclassified Burkholderia]|uniref:hypothetical protein n=1 Tax=unclassified Burkholderia TaxID=2613784 RepID=UPI0016261D08|nr:MULTISPECIES: hypothetical protein [unclassified Burkholderia]
MALLIAASRRHLDRIPNLLQGDFAMTARFDEPVAIARMRAARVDGRVTFH